MKNKKNVKHNKKQKKKIYISIILIGILGLITYLIYLKKISLPNIFVTETAESYSTLQLTLDQNPNIVTSGNKISYMVKATQTSNAKVSAIALAFDVNSEFVITNLYNKFLPAQTITNTLTKSNNKVIYLLTLKSPTEIPPNTLLFTIVLTAPNKTSQTTYNKVLTAIKNGVTPSYIDYNDNLFELDYTAITSSKLVVNSASKPTIGNLYVKHTVAKTTTDIESPVSDTFTDFYVVSGDDMTLYLDGISDTDGVKRVEIWNTYSNTKIADAVKEGSRYKYTYINGAPIYVYKIKVKVFDTGENMSEKQYHEFYVRPDFLTIAPNGYTGTTLPLVTITNPASNTYSLIGSLNVIYAYCEITDTNCSNPSSENVYGKPFTPTSNKLIKAFIRHSTGLEGGVTISNPYIKK